MNEVRAPTFFIDRCLGNKLIVETLRGAGVSVEIHDDHFAQAAQDIYRYLDLRWERVDN